MEFKRKRILSHDFKAKTHQYDLLEDPDERQVRLPNVVSFSYLSNLLFSWFCYFFHFAIGHLRTNCSFDPVTLSLGEPFYALDARKQYKIIGNNDRTNWSAFQA